MAYCGQRTRARVKGPFAQSPVWANYCLLRNPCWSRIMTKQKKDTLSMGHKQRMTPPETMSQMLVGHLL